MNAWIQKRMIRHFHAAQSWRKIDALLRHPNFLIKKSLPDMLGYSHKHSVHLVTKMCGLSPKMVHRIYRIKNVLNLPNLIADHTWSQITYDFGYSDQSHFIREFKHFTGFTPLQVVERIPKDFLLKQLR